MTKISISKFEEILASPEGYVIDFKRQAYDFSGNKPEANIKKLKFAKDIVSFSNTIRFTPAYIVLGVEDNGSLCGIDISNANQYRDSAKFQQILDGQKVTPTPCFGYYEIYYKNLCFGIIEIGLPQVDAVVRMGYDGIAYIRKNSSTALIQTGSQEEKEVEKWLKKISEINWNKLKQQSTDPQIQGCLDQHDFVKAGELLEKKRILLQQEKLQSTLLLAHIYEVQNKYFEANRLYLDTLKEFPKNPILLKELSMSYFEIDDYQNAQKVFMELLDVFDYDLLKIEDFLKEQEQNALIHNPAHYAKLDADIAAVMFLKGEREASIEKLKQVHHVFKEYYGEDSIKTKNVFIVLELLKSGMFSPLLSSIDIRQALDMLRQIS